jgi:hypothetical protein
VFVLAREDVEVNLRVLQTMTEQFELYHWGIAVLENCIAVRK